MSEISINIKDISENTHERVIAYSLIIGVFGNILMLVNDMMTFEYPTMLITYFCSALFYCGLYVVGRKWCSNRTLSISVIVFSIAVLVVQWRIVTLAYHTLSVSLIFTFMLIVLLLEEGLRMAVGIAYGILIVVAAMVDTSRLKTYDETIDYMDYVFGTLLIGVLVVFLVVSGIKHLKDIQDKTVYWSLVDALTGAGNVRMLDHDLENSTDRWKLQNRNFALAMIDIDDLKQINDRYGHLVGDQYIVHFVDIVKTCIRQQDRIYRYGGDEFIVLFDGSIKEHALSALDRIFEMMKSEPVDRAKSIYLSASVGLVDSTEMTGNTTNLIRLADEKLYEAKHSGKNKAVK